MNELTEKLMKSGQSEGGAKANAKGCAKDKAWKIYEGIKRRLPS